MTDKIIKFNRSDSEEENIGDKETNEQQLTRLKKENRDFGIKFREFELQIQIITLQRDKIAIEFSDYRDETERKISKSLQRNNEIMLKYQQSESEKEAALRYIEAGRSEREKFDIRAWGRGFGDTAKYMLLAVFGVCIATTAAILGKPTGHMARDNEEDDALEDYNAPHIPENDALKSFDLDKVSRPVGINSVEVLKPEPEEEKKKPKGLPWGK